MKSHYHCYFLCNVATPDIFPLNKNEKAIIQWVTRNIANILDFVSFDKSHVFWKILSKSVNKLFPNVPHRHTHRHRQTEGVTDEATNSENISV